MKIFSEKEGSGCEYNEMRRGTRYGQTLWQKR